MIHPANELAGYHDAVRLRGRQDSLFPGVAQVGGAVMVGLVADVGLDMGEVGGRHRKCTVTALPPQGVWSPHVRGPRGPTFEVTHEVGHRDCGGHRAQQVDMVLDASDHGPRTTQRTGLVGQRRLQPGAHARRQRGRTVPGRPEKMHVDFLPSLGHARRRHARYQTPAQAGGVMIGVPGMGRTSEVKVLSEAGRSDRSEPQGGSPQGSC